MQERRKTGRRRQKTEEGGKDYHADEAVKNCGQHLTSDKGKSGRERNYFCTRQGRTTIMQRPKF